MSSGIIARTARRRSQIYLGYQRRTNCRQYSEHSRPPPQTSNTESSSSAGGQGRQGEGKEKERSAHAQWYADTVPAMIPVALLGSAVYIGLQLLQNKLSTEKYLDEANARIKALEEEIELLRRENAEHGVLKTLPAVIDKKPDSTSRWWFTSA